MSMSSMLSVPLHSEEPGEEDTSSSQTLSSVVSSPGKSSGSKLYVTVDETG